MKKLISEFRDLKNRLLDTTRMSTEVVESASYDGIRNWGHNNNIYLMVYDMIIMNLCPIRRLRLLFNHIKPPDHHRQQKTRDKAIPDKKINFIELLHSK